MTDGAYPQRRAPFSSSIEEEILILGFAQAR
jgi:hypothetical protein